MLLCCVSRIGRKLLAVEALSNKKVVKKHHRTFSGNVDTQVKHSGSRFSVTYSEDFRQVQVFLIVRLQHCDIGSVFRCVLFCSQLPW